MSVTVMEPFVRKSGLPSMIFFAHSQNFLSEVMFRLSVISPYFVLPGRFAVMVLPNTLVATTSVTSTSTDDPPASLKSPSMPLSSAT